MAIWGIFVGLASLAWACTCDSRRSGERPQIVDPDPQAAEPEPRVDPKTARFFEENKQFMAGPVGSSCGGGDAFVVLMNGHRSAHRSFRSGGTQPSMLVSLANGEGKPDLLLVDLGDDAAIFAHNLGAWSERSGVMAGGARRAVVLSHGHTLASAPPDQVPGGPKPSRRKRPPRSDGFAAAWEALGPFEIQAPNLADFVRHRVLNPAWIEAGLSPKRRVELPAGLRRLRWSDGSASDRVWLLTYDISPPEQAPPFVPRETAVVVRTPEPAGYLVYTACSHLAAKARVRGRVPAHAVTLVKQAIDAGKLPAGPVHTLVTGSCGLWRTFEMTGGMNPSQGSHRDELRRQVSRLAGEVGLKRVLLVHCATTIEPLEIMPVFKETLGDGARIGFPGACLPLSPSP